MKLKFSGLGAFAIYALLVVLFFVAAFIWG
jgi:hypothetical protein